MTLHVTYLMLDLIKSNAFRNMPFAAYAVLYGYGKTVPDAQY